ncbi:phosphoribosylglycinamide formyltransferase-1 [Mesorhizobium albiziae]|uniref:Phosphoribosylglycinamide formyltransferase n=1 Tax=Neomesorhizobium albiziae TaxID=335020 RepID=A0A1I4DHA5_9HYPH|nr:phosphoribosylglycinamide formyltransferase [Mesorhizobium albiziae]GLS32349.1 phosphoribosylglycinamide formyltransferase [Mesorhizobium albiziae]SFK91271.1 phosphoribosylglycinamide formyltransferase-1 [Mesorhizobium albiziae]
MSTKRKRIVVLISGRGSNMAALIEAAREADYPAEIVGVISDQPDAAGLKAAESFHIATRAIPRRDHASKQAHDAAIDAALRKMGADIVCLAGYMRLLTPGFVDKWLGRMINIHPSLLPMFKGLDTHKRALDAGLRVHGCTVHFVTRDMDDGPVVAQAAVPVLTNDTEERLTARVLKAEHKLYPLALALVASGKARMEAGRTVFEGVDHTGDSGVIMVPGTWQGASDLEDLARFTP